MKSIKLVLIIATTIILMTSCRKEPTACFSINKATAKVGETVIFTDCSTDATRRVLTIGEFASGFPMAVDFESGTAQHFYHTVGAYTVELEALNCTKDNKCKSDKTSQTITITP